MPNYFKSLNFRNKLKELNKCRLMKKEEFKDGVNVLKSKKIVILGCGAQGLNQGLNMRDSGLDVSFALKSNSIKQKNKSWQNAIINNFRVDTYKILIPTADIIINLTPDKQHPNLIRKIEPLIKKNAVLGFSHGFYIVEVNDQIRKDITVIMVAPKCPGTEVREEYKRGFGVPTLIAVHTPNDPIKEGLNIAKSWAFALGGHKAGVLHSSFSAEVKSDLMGEQTILCGLLQSGSLAYYEKLISDGFDPAYSAKFIQSGWEVFTESLKHGGISLMFDRLSNQNKFRAFMLSKQLKNLLKPLFYQHMDNIIEGVFSSKMIQDWNNDDMQLIHWREQTKKSKFEQAPKYNQKILEQEYFDNGAFMIALLKSGIELAFEIMTETGIIEMSAYYESLHELPLIANTIARKRLYEMNLVISDTAEYGNYLFSEQAFPILKQFMCSLKTENLNDAVNQQKINNINLHKINETIRNHPIELIGKKLRSYMIDMKAIAVGL